MSSLKIRKLSFAQEITFQLIGPRAAEHTRTIDFSTLLHVKEEGHSAHGVSGCVEAIDTGVAKGEREAVKERCVRRFVGEKAEIGRVQKALRTAERHQLLRAAHVIVMPVGMENIFNVLDVKAENSHRIDDDVGSFVLARVDQDQSVARVDQVRGRRLSANEIQIPYHFKRCHIRKHTNLQETQI